MVDTSEEASCSCGSWAEEASRWSVFTLKTVCAAAETPGERPCVYLCGLCCSWMRCRAACLNRLGSKTSSSANDQGGGEVPVRETPNGFSLSAAAEPRAADVSRTRTSMFDGTQEEDVERSVPSSWWAEDSDGSISDSHRRWDVWREGRGMGGGHVTPSVPGWWLKSVYLSLATTSPRGWPWCITFGRMPAPVWASPRHQPEHRSSLFWTHL